MKQAHVSPLAPLPPLSPAAAASTSERGRNPPPEEAKVQPHQSNQSILPYAPLVRQRGIGASLPPPPPMENCTEPHSSQTPASRPAPHLLSVKKEKKYMIVKSAVLCFVCKKK